jgi:glycosyltransferase involved in cell wall biosynthesis
LRIVQLNLAFDASFHDPEALLDRYHTLTGWSGALTAAGAEVRVVQRFSRDATITRDGVVYDFVNDGERERLTAWTVSAPAVARIPPLQPDVVHVNGLMFPGMIGATRAAAGDGRVVIAQDHSGVLPTQRIWPLQPLVRSRWTRAFRQLDACTFTARELASRWHAAGLPETIPIIEIPEASTTFVPIDRGTARTLTGMAGAPAILWVGRVDENKDPVTVLSGVDRALAALPDGHLSMIIPEHADDRHVRVQIAASRELRDRATIIGPVSYKDMPRYYSAADIFVSGSHHEGSGYALIEAMACGVVPCVTGIPAFRALVADSGMFWRVGDASSLAAALQQVVSQDLREQRGRARQRFVDALSWPAIGRRTFDAYADLLERRHTAMPR